MKQSISAVLITKNEEMIIEKCLLSLRWCNEIIIVDSCSTDNTKVISQKFGEKVKFHEQPFLGYGKQKQFAVSKASYDWILSIDADEVITESLATEISNLIQYNQNPHESTAWKIPRTLVFMGKKLNFSGESKRPVLRLFNRKYFNFNDAIVHEEVIGTGNILCLQHEMLHFSYKNWSDYIQKLNGYTDQMAIKLKNNGSSKKPLPALRFISTFIKIYFLKFGFLDGKAGFTWAISSSFANMLKYLKFDDLLTSPKTNI